MAIEVHVELRTKDTTNAAKRGDVIVIIDVLYCYSTIIAALAKRVPEIVLTPTARKAMRARRLVVLVMIMTKKIAELSNHLHGIRPIKTQA